MVERLKGFEIEISNNLETAIQNGTPREANILLGLRALVQAGVAELELYLLLKQDLPDEAWDQLIKAQSSIGAAMRADLSFLFLEAKAIRLRALEDYLFPPQQFLSAGLIVGYQECSICKESYDQCNHIAGRPYHGRFCNIILKDVTGDHVALVDEPANRHCRVTAFSVPGGTRNKMSWVITPHAVDHQSQDLPEGAMIAHSTIASIEDFGGEWPSDLPFTRAVGSDGKYSKPISERASRQPEPRHPDFS